MKLSLPEWKIEKGFVRLVDEIYEIIGLEKINNFGWEDFICEKDKIEYDGMYSANFRGVGNINIIVELMSGEYDYRLIVEGNNGRGVIGWKDSIWRIFKNGMVPINYSLVGNRDIIQELSLVSEIVR